MFDNLLKEDFKTQFKKFTEKEGIDKDTVQYYFKFFKRIKNKFPKAFEIEGLKTSIPIEKRKDIDAYQTFKDLENVVDYLRGQVDLGEDEKVQITNDTTVYEDDNLKISKGTSPENCISIRQAGSKGKDISWCVARKTGSLYYSYRFNKEEPTFYFVLNKNKKTTDKYFFFVVQVTNTGGYVVTSSENDGDKPMSWEDIIGIEPLLTNLKSVFKYEKIKPEEREAAGLDKITYKSYPTLTYTQKKKYIEGLRNLSDSMFKVTPIELLEYYVNLNAHLLSTNQIIFLGERNPKLLKRYYVLLNRKIENNEFLKDLKKLDDDNSYEIDLDKYKGGDLIESVRNERNNFYGASIVLDVKNMDDVYRAADIEPYLLSYVIRCANGGCVSNESNPDELDNMSRYFDNQTDDLMIKLLTVIGLPKNQIDDLMEHYKSEELNNFLEKFSFGEQIFEKFAEEHMNATDNGRENSAKEILKVYNELPLEFNRGRYATIDITDINDFISAIISIDPTISNFEDAVIKLLESADLDGELEIDEYNNMDTTELNVEIRNVIESIIEDIKTGYNEDIPYVNNIYDVLDKLKFKERNFENDLVSIKILSFKPNNIDDKNPTIEIEFINKKSNKKEVGNIPLSSLPNYVQNYQLFEELTRIKKMMIIM
jgi:hypothetical protein